MYANGNLCPICGEGSLERKEIKETFEYKGSHLTIDNYIVYECNECEESIVDPKTLKDTEKMIRDFHREVDGLLISSDIRQIRNSFQYTQETFGEILGGGKKSFARYENGSVTQSKPMDNLLRILKRFPYTIIALLEKDEKDLVYETIGHEPKFIIWDTILRKSHYLEKPINHLTETVDNYVTTDHKDLFEQNYCQIPYEVRRDYVPRSFPTGTWESPKKKILSKYTDVSDPIAPSPFPTKDIAA